MEVHQTEFVQAVALAAAVALAMTIWDTSPQDARVQIVGTPSRSAVTQTGVKNSYVVAPTRKGEIRP